jgi:Flp pilus assembly protein TadG
MRFQGQRHTDRTGQNRGQSLVEFALVLPIVLILEMAIVDFARLYTTMLTVESAAREAADYGAFHWYNWQDTDSTNLTAAEMERRACVAARNLPDYAESGGTCTNPAFAYSLAPPPGGPSIDCSAEPSPSDDPCRVTVTLTYDFHLFAPLSLEFFGMQLGLPNSLSFSRDSTFAISNFGIDNP